MEADDLRSRLAKLLKKKDSELWLEHTIKTKTAPDNLNTVIIPALKKNGVNAEVVNVKEHIEGLRLLDAGGADAYASDRVLLIGLAIQSSDIRRLRLGDEYLSYEPYGFMVRRNDAAFRLVANRVLSGLYRSLEIEQIYERWFGALGTPSSLLQAMYLLNGLPE